MIRLAAQRRHCVSYACASGPGKAWTALEQGEYLFELAERKPFFIRVPVALMDGIIGFLDLLAKVFPGLEVRRVIGIKVWGVGFACSPCCMPPCSCIYHGGTGGSSLL